MESKESPSEVVPEVKVKLPILVVVSKDLPSEVVPEVKVKSPILVVVASKVLPLLS